MKEKNFDHLFKIVLIGNSSTGKTSLLQRYRENEFHPDTKHTIGVEFATQEMEIDNEVIKAQIWDTAGQERYRAITKAYYRGAFGAIVVFDVADRETFDGLTRWIGEIKGHANEGIKIVLVGNKCDLKNREISQNEGKAFAEQFGIPYMETSAKTGEMVQSMFESLLEEIYRAKKTEALENNNESVKVGKGEVVDLNTKKKKKESNCC
eukprot:maker-scaffold_67-snap-gene-0.7-mRNA-1 protein AED:0.30 eAED:0.30 QI:89/1/1/1/1/1/2/22/207